VDSIQVQLEEDGGGSIYRAGWRQDLVHQSEKAQKSSRSVVSESDATMTQNYLTKKTLQIIIKTTELFVVHHSVVLEIRQRTLSD